MTSRLNGICVWVGKLVERRKMRGHRVEMGGYLRRGNGNTIVGECGWSLEDYNVVLK